MHASDSTALNPLFHTPRLTLEPLLGGHAAALFPLLWEPRARLWLADPKARTAEELAARWTRNEARTSPDGAAGWLAWAARRTADGVYLGKLDAVVTGAVAPNVGYVFGPSHWGHGYATEAVGAVVAHLSRHGVKELRATVTVGNDASCRVLERLGFARRGALAAHDVIRGVPHDAWLYVRAAAG